MISKSIFIVSSFLGVFSLICMGQNDNYKKANLQKNENHARITHPKIEQKLYKLLLKFKKKIPEKISFGGGEDCTFCLNYINRGN